jgi:hypothetical protein
VRGIRLRRKERGARGVRLFLGLKSSAGKWPTLHMSPICEKVLVFALCWFRMYAYGNPQFLPEEEG